MAWVKELLATLVLLDSPPCITPMCNNAWAPQSSTFQNRKIPKCHQKMPKKKSESKTAQLHHLRSLPSITIMLQFLPVPSSSFRPGLSLCLPGVLADHAAAAPPWIVVQLQSQRGSTGTQSGLVPLSHFQEGAVLGIPAFSRCYWWDLVGS